MITGAPDDARVALLGALAAARPAHLTRARLAVRWLACSLSPSPPCRPRAGLLIDRSLLPPLSLVCTRRSLRPS